ncbi:ferrochelatase [Caulobacter hibisci]|uniref:Ferrochelatase n=1 Tax=Caulobacter hibisci TaxID=2035993 RepID=A0ABS0SXN6_9CAUL|nr:ferrochelatase [Caulobacter hibisci]
MSELKSGRRIAVVLFNLGGPDGQAAVRPFLFNLFRDPAIIQAPFFVRYPVATLISTTRAKLARENYALMGGGSPLLPETQKQAKALEAVLAQRLPGDTVQTFIAMRYWNPLTGETAKAVKAFAPDEVVLLPLYPQYSTTTTASSLNAWKRAWRKLTGRKDASRTTTVCCYPTAEGFVQAHADLIRAEYLKAGSPKPARILFSAHGLPEKVILGGDPYQRHVEATAAAVVAQLGDILGEGVDWKISYQSRVGPLKWIGPSTDEEVEAAAKAGLALVVTPIAFVSEHIETLVELDVEYRELAYKHGGSIYVRVPALGVTPAFIDCLGTLVTQALADPSSLICEDDQPCAGAAA